MWTTAQLSFRASSSDNPLSLGLRRFRRLLGRPPSVRWCSCGFGSGAFGVPMPPVSWMCFSSSDVTW